jgi:flagellar hook-basal body complex protein FliE
MDIPDPIQAAGDVVTMARTNPRHLAGIGESAPAAAGGPERSFGQLLIGALGNVNDSQITSMDLTQRMVTKPDSVNVHDVTIALAEANLALSMTKAIVDRALAAYREIINVR